MKGNPDKMFLRHLSLSNVNTVVPFIGASSLSWLCYRQKTE